MAEVQIRNAQIQVAKFIGQLNIPRDVRYRLVHDLLQSVDIDFFTVTMLCDSNDVESRRSFIAKLLKRSVFPSAVIVTAIIIASSFSSLGQRFLAVFGTAESANLLLSSVVTAPIQFLFRPLATVTGVLDEAQVEIFNDFIQMIWAYMVSIFGNLALGYVTGNQNQIAQGILNTLDDPTQIQQRTRFNCYEVWKNLYKINRIPFNDKKMEEAFLERFPYLKALWEEIHSHNAPDNPNEDIDIEQLDFDRLLPFIREDSRLTNTAINAFAYTPNLGKGFLSYLQTIVRKKTPYELQEDPRLFISIHAHGTAIINGLRQLYIESLTVNLIASRYVGSYSPVLRQVLEDITYALCSGIFSLYLDDNMNDCINEVHSHGFVFTNTWTVNPQHPDRNAHLIRREHTVKCTIFKMYSTMLQLIPGDIKRDAYQVWVARTRAVNNSLGQLLPENDEGHSYLESIVNRMSRYFISGQQFPQQRDVDDI